jgi:CRP-like cAMP-binding protein
MSSILSKLNVTNRSEAIIVALRMQRVVWEQIRMAEQGDLDLGALLPHMEHRAHRVNDVLFRMNDVGKELYYLQQGRVRLPELGLEMKERDVFGELGLFATGHRRTSSAVCATDVDLFVMSEVKAKQMYFLNPAFAMYMVNLVSQRLVAQRGPPGTASNGA